MSTWMRGLCEARPFKAGRRGCQWIYYQFPALPLSMPIDLRSSLMPTNLVQQADEIMRYAEILLGEHRTIIRHDHRSLAEDRMLR